MITKKGLERRISEEERFIPKNTKVIDELSLKLEQVLREIEAVKKAHEDLNMLGIVNKGTSKNIIVRNQELERLRKEGVNVVRA